MKNRPDPLEQGHLKELWTQFFGKLVPLKAPQQSIGEFMEVLFDFKNRDIVRYRVQREFKMPGLFCVTPLMKIQGVGMRSISVDDILWVRRDARTPNQIDVEVIGTKDQVFALTESEWGWVALHLDEAERPPKKDRSRK